MYEETKERGTNVHWNCIVITCSNSKFKDFIEKETNKLSKAELLPSHDFLLVVEDPQPTLLKQNLSRGVGSGGATLNALLVVTERLSALANRTTLLGQLRQELRIV
ncbi:hypothetical protein Avbf_08783 [Armadillidium vulgare]|nr:hypothetical protein Avbf_08783 [Armadillidium vulgare]